MQRRFSRLCIFLAGLFIAIPKLASAETALGIRYVWASKLVLRTAPDRKSDEVARLSYGMQVTLLEDSPRSQIYREKVAKLHASGEHPASEVTLDGYWRHVAAAGKEGWVFDGYLSRYPAPVEGSSQLTFGDDEIAYAAQVFGVAHSWQWKKGDGKNSESYKIMRRQWKLDENTEASEINWSRVEFKLGGSAEISTIVGNGSSSNLAFVGLPLTFNESLLWWLHFHPFEGSGIFEPSRRLEIGPSDEDDNGLGYGRSILCSDQTCNISRDVVD